MARGERQDVELYFDLASPYAYLAVRRAPAVLGRAPRLRPVLLGAMFRWRGYGSWAATPQRAPRMAEIEARAAHAGLPPMRWPEGWPLNSLAAMRAAVWADEQDMLEAFVQAAYRHEFEQGEDISGIDALARIAGEAGLPGADLAAAVASQPIKDRLRAATEAAWERGVRSIPTTAVGDVLIPGDDQLEQIPLLAAG